MRKYRVCMLCDRLDLGGAETHIVTLANRLAADGHEVTVLSGGGRLVSSLSGVRHITLPLFRKRAFFSLLFSLRRLLRHEHFDVLHAHTRFTAFLCRHLAKKRTVTTAHWIFDTAFPKGSLTFWGKEALAVSEDIAAYLTENYKIPREQITVTVNGIDDRLFAPRKKESDVRHIVSCTRMDPDRSLAAFCLLDAAARLPHGAFTLTLIGDGADLAALKKKADALTAAHPSLSLRLTGGLSDVSPYLAEADIFVGVSRAALEGMASGCATILAGNEGYLSIFDPEDAAVAESSNFCCRGAEKTTSELLFRDLSRLLSLPPSHLRKMGDQNRLYVRERYSVERMAKDALSVYEKICKREVVLCGYYGFYSVGDELLARALEGRLREEGYGKIRFLSARWLSPSALAALLNGYDLLLGGGNLLQDATSRRSLSFYLFCAKCARGRIIIHGGIGPLSDEGERRARPLLSRASGVYPRTAGDLCRARALGATDPILSADAALTLPYPKKGKGEQILLAFRAPSPEEEPLVVAFVLHLCHVFGKERLSLFAMHAADLSFAKRLSRLCGISFFRGGADTFVRLLTECRAVFASRLHAGVCALGMGIPFLLWSGEEKCRFFVEDVKNSTEENGFCALFSFGDRPKELPSPHGAEEAKRKLLSRL